MASIRIQGPRGQVAVENLMLYAVVIAAIAVGLIALWQTGVLKPPVGRRGYVGFSQIVPEDWIVTVSNRVFIRFKNEGDSAAILHEQGMNITVGRVQCTLGPSSPRLLEASRKVTLNFTCNNPPMISDDYDIGDEVWVTVSVNYTNVDSDNMHQSVGQIYTHLEGGDAGALIDPDTTTTIMPSPFCFEATCDKPGEVDNANCGNVTWQEECIYCRKDLLVCWYNGACGETCSVDLECVNFPSDAYLREINRCQNCIEFPAGTGNFTCQEEIPVPEPVCGPCPSVDWGRFDSVWCDIVNCPYCYREWTQLTPLPGDGFYSFTCEQNESCGESCIDYGFDIYEDCEDRCTHCQPDLSTPDPIDGACEQGDCGRRCGPSAPIEECLEGCLWCNTTTYDCQMGDCGELCGPSNPSMTCNLGCDVCYGPNRYGEYKCIWGDIGVTLYAHNESVGGGKVVDIYSPIYLDVTGTCDEGIATLIVSNATELADFTGMGITDCTGIANQINNDYPTGITDPFAPAFLSYLSTTWDLNWNGTHTCPGLTSCWNQWVQSESVYGTYCYIAMAQKTGSGRWSSVVADYIQVGDINVFLVYPRPE